MKEKVLFGISHSTNKRRIFAVIFTVHTISIQKCISNSYLQEMFVYNYIDINLFIVSFIPFFIPQFILLGISSLANRYGTLPLIDFSLSGKSALGAKYVTRSHDLNIMLLHC